MSNLDVTTTSRVVTVTGTSSREELYAGLIDAIPRLIPGVPNSAIAPVIFGVLRAVAAFVGGLGFAWGKYVTGDEATMAVYAAIGLAALLWSGYQKVRSEIAKIRLAATASAESAKATATATIQRGEPTPVAVVPLPPRSGTTPSLKLAA